MTAERPRRCRSTNFLLPCLSAVCVSALFLSSCAQLQAAFGAAEATEAPYTAAPSPSASPTPEPTRFSINPVYDLCLIYSEKCLSYEQRLVRALGDHGTLEAFRLSMRLTSHITYISEPQITVCRLFEGDYGEYSGSVDGAGAGSGTVSSNEAGDYELSYVYSGGANGLTGTYHVNTSAMEFTLGSYEYFEAALSTPSFLFDTDGEIVEEAEETGTVSVFTPSVSCRMEKTADGWTSTVDDGASVSYFMLSGGTVSFTYGGITATLDAEGTLSIVPAQETTEAG